MNPNYLPGVGTTSDLDALRAALEHARHLLPTQPPIAMFVHHNTLHAFEHLPFAQAVVEAAGVFGTRPYLEEADFLDAVESGRIAANDLAAVLADYVVPNSAFAPAADDDLPTAAAVAKLRLGLRLPNASGAGARWWVEESELGQRLITTISDVARTQLLADGSNEPALLAALWQRCLVLAEEASAVRSRGAPVSAARTRDGLVAMGAQDPDSFVHPVLIRLVASFLDQGISYWPMPARDQGFLGAVASLYRHGSGPAPWLRRLPNLVADHLVDLDAVGAAADAATAQPDPAERAILRALQALAIERSAWGPFITSTLLALRGWAGMMAQIELRPDRAPVKAPPARLVDFLAVRLWLDALAAEHVADAAGVDASPAAWISAEIAPPAADVPGDALELFALAQHAGLGPTALTGDAALRWARDVLAFNDLERRALLQRAFERRHRVATLDGMLAHVATSPTEPKSPSAQVVFCIDDREESMRRHLEEVAPDVRTYGSAGFFGIPMVYQGIEDAHAGPLSPVSILPDHLIAEKARHQVGSWRERRNLIGRVGHALAIGSNTVVRGSIVTALAGLFRALPLVLHTLQPRLAAAAVHHMAQVGSRSPPTRLDFSRDADAEEGGVVVGFTIQEQVGIVAALLEEIGLVADFAPLVVLVGHGSQSMNNPHSSAYDCGACGGAHGGPNARAFAAMANRNDVRVGLVGRGIHVPASTVFLGAKHNTGNDALTWFDVEDVPEAARAALHRLQRSAGLACERNAHERCRRFAQAPHQGAARALRHVEGRSVDLAQPRSECGHATNAVCVVGPRRATRGLFLDRRAFLVSYEPANDADGRILERLLSSVAPVGAGINLEYWFSFVDPATYGCGTKLPHNINGLLGVMDGHQSDLRTGLPWQMVEIHEPVRLLTVVYAEPEALLAIAGRVPAVGRLVGNGWIQLVAISPRDGSAHVFQGGAFVAYEPETTRLTQVESSRAHYDGHLGHLGPAHIGAMSEVAA